MAIPPQVQQSDPAGTGRRCRHASASHGADYRVIGF